MLTLGANSPRAAPKRPVVGRVVPVSVRSAARRTSRRQPASPAEADVVPCESDPMPAARPLLSKLRKPRVWRRLLLERASEPLHLNFASMLVLAFGSFRAKVDWDL